MNTVKAEKLFKEVAQENDVVEDMIDTLRDYNSAGELTNEEYDYLIVEWDNLLKKYSLY